MSRAKIGLVEDNQAKEKELAEKNAELESKEKEIAKLRKALRAMLE